MTTQSLTSQVGLLHKILKKSLYQLNLTARNGRTNKNNCEAEEEMLKE